MKKVIFINEESDQRISVNMKSGESEQDAIDRRAQKIGGKNAEFWPKTSDSKGHGAICKVYKYDLVQVCNGRIIIE